MGARRRRRWRVTRSSRFRENARKQQRPSKKNFNANKETSQKRICVFAAVFAVSIFWREILALRRRTGVRFIFRFAVPCLTKFEG